MFASNSAHRGGAIYLEQGTVVFDGGTTFKQNSAKKDGGALLSIGATIYFNHNVKVQLNSAQENGGALYLDSGSSIMLKNETKFNTSFNSALGYGGGIYYVDNPELNQCNYSEIKQLPRCFLQLAVPSNVTITSYYDYAGVDGSFLYGGLLDRCKIHTNHDRTLYTSC